VTNLKTILALNRQKTGEIIAIASDEWKATTTQLMRHVVDKGWGAVVSDEGLRSYDEVLEKSNVRELRGVKKLVASGFKDGQLTIVSDEENLLSASSALAKAISVLIHITDGWVRVGLDVMMKALRVTKEAA
jgi:hypothetical protein